MGIIANLLDSPRFFNFIQLLLEGDYAQFIAEELQAKEGEKILDVGCGTGYFSRIIKGRYWGVDINPHFIKYAANRYGGKNKCFVRANAFSAPFAEKFFNKSMVINVIHHLDEKQVKELLIKLVKLTRDSILLVDMVPPPENRFLSHLLLKLDRGNYIRDLNDQLRIIGDILPIKKSKTFVSPRGLCLHSLVLCPIE